MDFKKMMSAFVDIGTEEGKKPSQEPAVDTTGNGNKQMPFPKLGTINLQPPPQSQPVATPAPPQAVTDMSPEEVVVEDPHLQKVVELVRSRVNSLAGSSYQQFNAVRERMQKKLQPGLELDLSLVCAAINASGRDLAREITVMEQGLQTAELEVSNEIDSEERDQVSGLESEINSLTEAISSRQEQILHVEQQLQSLRSEQLGDQRSLSQKQSSLKSKQATFTASRNRLRAARIRVAQELAAQKRTFSTL